jgi:heme-degrading monooxygenase HmoA
MSVIMTLRMKGDPAALEREAAADPDAIRSISDRAKGHGLIAHRFYGSEDGSEIIVVDEWPDRASFEAFFGEASDQIQPLMQSIGVSSEPEIRFWRKLDSHDEVGWGA